MYPPPVNPPARIDKTQDGLTYGQSAAGGVGKIQGNTRQIVFLEFKQADIKKDPLIDPGALGAYFSDPWGRPYHFRLDVNYANQVENPFLPAATAAANPMTGMGFLIWSVGPDGRYDQGDTIVGIPPPLVVKSSALNKDNVNSW